MSLSLKATVAALMMVVPVGASVAADIVVHRDPGCGCCGKWAAQMKAQLGRRVQIVDDANRAAFQKARGVPADLASCHTAIIEGMTFEGHVPISDVKRLLASRPKGISGLEVAGMPMGSPGMEMAGMRAQPYEVVAFGPGVRRVFARHG